jgi:6-phosphogluconolactonase
MSGEPELVVVPDLDVLATEAAERIATTLADAVRARGRADWATTGGSSVPAIYRHLAAAPLRDVVPWDSVRAWWGDDRYVPRDHPLSNVKPFDDILLSVGAAETGQLGPGTAVNPKPVPIPIEQLHPFPTTLSIGHARGAAWCASELAAELDGADLDRSGRWSVFDLIVVGIGADGHLLSVFPGSPALQSNDLAMAIPAPTHIEPHVERVTLNPAVLGAARRVLAVVAGDGKAAVLADVLGGQRDSSRWPAQLARLEQATWIVDSAAASRLPR